jgi:hypothetical protein
MRRLALTLLAAVAVVPTAALAARSATGDGVFELRDVNGTVALAGKGVLWGQMDRGAMRITDLDPTGGKQPLVSGAERVIPAADPNTTIYTGTNIHFRLTGGKFRVRFRATGIDLTAIGVGTATLTGDTALTVTGKTGDYAVDGGNWTPVPLLEQDVPFGAQPAPPAPATKP